MPKKLYKVAESSIHQSGLFAAAKIKAGTDILQYVGEKISKETEENLPILRNNLRSVEISQGSEEDTKFFGVGLSTLE